MSDPLFDLAQQTELVLDHLGTPRRDAGRTLAWAVFNLRAARIGERIVGELGLGIHGYDRLESVLPETWDVFEVAAMSLGFEDVMTALDLCAHAAYLAAGGTPNAAGSFVDLGYWTPARINTLPAATKAWMEELLAHPDVDLLRQCRYGLAHRLVTRHIRIGGGVDRALAEISTLPTPAGAPGTSLGSIADLIPRLLRFGEAQYSACCLALQADFGRHAP